MTFIELVMFLAERGEKILTHKDHEIISTQYRYCRDDKRNWVRDNEPGSPKVMYGRGGAYYVWHSELEDIKVVEKKDA